MRTIVPWRWRPNGVGAIVDTEKLSCDDWVTCMTDLQDGEECPKCHCVRTGWDCAGCGYEFDTPWTPGPQDS